MSGIIEITEGALNDLWDEAFSLGREAGKRHILFMQRVETLNKELKTRTVSAEKGQDK